MGYVTNLINQTSIETIEQTGGYTRRRNLGMLSNEIADMEVFRNWELPKQFVQGVSDKRTQSSEFWESGV
uniref:Uncharacterized protein n=1 Tax=Parascaris equorum TaxID=6256 RepID=A0A914R502_PAREQ